MFTYMSVNMNKAFSPGYKIDGKYNYITTPTLSDPVLDEGTVFIRTKGSLYALLL